MMKKADKNKKRKEYIDYEAKVCERLAQLRLIAKVSCREMSLAIGLSEGYINKIENGKTLPSMQNFFYICEYLDVTPKEFFSFIDADEEASEMLRFLRLYTNLSEKRQKLVMLLLGDMQ